MSGRHTGSNSFVLRSGGLRKAAPPATATVRAAAARQAVTMHEQDEARLAARRQLKRDEALSCAQRSAGASLSSRTRQ